MLMFQVVWQSLEQWYHPFDWV